MPFEEVYLAFGGNIGDTVSLLRRLVDDLKNTAGIRNVVLSRFFETTPVSAIPQDNYVNAACRLETSIDPFLFLQKMQEIERRYGTKSSLKDAPRYVDIDILFFGNVSAHYKELTIPHPRWMERLFVLRPLRDLVRFLIIPDGSGGTMRVDLEDVLARFPNIHREVVVPINVQEVKVCIK